MRRLVRLWDDRDAEHYYVLQSFRRDYYGFAWFRRSWQADAHGNEKWASRIADHYPNIERVMMQ